MSREIYRLQDVFVPGGQPHLTYEPRPRLRLEEQIRDYLDGGSCEFLSLGGPSKSGKTVLLREVLGGRPCYWIDGGSTPTIEDFWAILTDKMQLIAEELTAERTSRTTTSSSAASVSALPMGIGGRGDHSSGGSETVEHFNQMRRTRPPAAAAVGQLAHDMYPLVIDDFHYLNPSTQVAVLRALKPLVYQGLPVLLCAASHRIHDAARVESELRGRVHLLAIPFWDREELESIAELGFAKLHASDPGELRLRLAAEALGSPHLMQDFCRELCRRNDLLATAENEIELLAPDFDPFFRSRAAASVSTAVRRLAAGPVGRAPRRARLPLKAGGDADIYEAVLLAVAESGPRLGLTYDDLRLGLRKVMSGALPPRARVVDALTAMSDIARRVARGPEGNPTDNEPVVEYIPSDDTLYITDPFFAFYLRWERLGPAGG